MNSLSPNEEHNIKVAIWVRPMLPRELQKKQFDTLKVEDNLIIAIDPIDIHFEMEGKNKMDVLHWSRA